MLKRRRIKMISNKKREGNSSDLPFNVFLMKKKGREETNSTDMDNFIIKIKSFLLHF
jgi:hypothetical protein